MDSPNTDIKLMYISPNINRKNRFITIKTSKAYRINKKQNISESNNVTGSDRKIYRYSFE